jgi:kynurenine formamidase
MTRRTLTHNYRREAEGFNAETVTLNTHTVTHVDVPYHFDDGGPTIEQVPLTAFAAPAVFLDLRERVKAGEPIGPHILDGTLDQLQHGDIAVLVTGWGAKRAVSEEYLKRWPYLGGDGAQLLLDHGISAVGIDALSIGGWDGPEKGEPATSRCSAPARSSSRSSTSSTSSAAAASSPSSPSCSKAAAERGHAPSPGNHRQRAMSALASCVEPRRAG